MHTKNLLLSQASQGKLLGLGAWCWPCMSLLLQRSRMCLERLGIKHSHCGQGGLWVSKMRQVALVLVQVTLTVWNPCTPKRPLTHPHLLPNQMFSSGTPERLQDSVMYLRLVHQFGLNAVQPDQFLRAASQEQRQSTVTSAAPSYLLLGLSPSSHNHRETPLIDLFPLRSRL